MAQTFDVSFQRDYSEILTYLAANADDSLRTIREAVQLKTGTRGSVVDYDRLNLVEMVPIVTRHGDTIHTPFTHTKRRATLANFGLNEKLDDVDAVKTMVSPMSDYSKRFVTAYNAELFRRVVKAMNGNAQAVGADDTVSTVALPSGQAIANGGTGFTVAKLRQAGRLLNEAGIVDGGRYVALNHFAIEDLLQDTQITSHDYMQLNAIAQGTIPNGAMVMGFKIIKVNEALGAGAVRSDPILPLSSNIRSCFAWQKDGVGLAIGKDITVEFARNPDKWNNPEVFVKTVLGAVRVEDEAVVKIDFDQSV